MNCERESNFTVISSPRTGSNLFFNLLENTGIVKNSYTNYEVLNPCRYKSIDFKSLNLKSFFRDSSMKTSSLFHGFHVSGFKIQPDQMFCFQNKVNNQSNQTQIKLKDILNSLPPDTKYIVLERRDKVRQAISFLRAQKSGSWLKINTDDEIDRDVSISPKEIEDKISEIERHNKIIDNLVDENNLDPLYLFYEDFEDNHEWVVRKVLDYLQLPIPEDLRVETDLVKQRDEYTEQLVEEYREYKKVDEKQIPDDFDWRQYVENYPDLREAGIDSREKAAKHWIDFGREEGRTYHGENGGDGLGDAVVLDGPRHGLDEDYPDDQTCCVVGILKNEEEFVEEWVAYHRLLGFDHFFLYDNDPDLPLKNIFSSWGFVTVVPWPKTNEECEGSMQKVAYKHTLKNFLQEYRWATFIDGDEFIVLRRHDSIKAFLNDFESYCAVTLNHYIFGHNGFYNNPDGLVIESLNTREKTITDIVKTIFKTSCVKSPDIHRQKLSKECVEVNVEKNTISSESNLQDKNKHPSAYINHYRYRSFKDYISKVDRGETVADMPEFKTTRKGRLKYFVEKIHELNQVRDDYMQGYVDDVKEFIEEMKSDKL